MPPHHETGRTSHVSKRRADGPDAKVAGTVPSDPSASEVAANADGARRWQRLGPISRHARVTEKVRHDSEVTAMPPRVLQRALRALQGTPTSHREVAA